MIIDYLVSVPSIKNAVPEKNRVKISKNEYAGGEIGFELGLNWVCFGFVLGEIGFELA